MKSSTSLGQAARFALNCEWKLVPVTNHRVVATRPIEKADKAFAQCKDCNRDSHLIIVELSRFTPQGHISEHDLVWGWCGICDIGRTT
jgi:hypothetical protein